MKLFDWISDGKRLREGLLLAGVGITCYIVGSVGTAALRPAPKIQFEEKDLPPSFLSEAPGEAKAPQAPAEETPTTVLKPVTEVVVHVSGAVKKPGLVHLKPDSRIDDAIREAGGAKADADLDSVNLAAKAEDGSKIVVLLKGETPPPEAAPATGTSSPGSSGKPAPRIVSLNTCTRDQLIGLPGIGPATADKIIAHRHATGGFSSVDQLLEVSGIGPKKLAAIRRYVRP